MKVVFRKFPEGDVIALFPEEPATERPAIFECMAYQHIGQHGSAQYGYVIAKTVPVTKTEYAPLLAELEQIGYTDLRICKRFVVTARARKTYRELYLEEENKGDTQKR